MIQQNTSLSIVFPVILCIILIKYILKQEDSLKFPDDRHVK